METNTVQRNFLEISDYISRLELRAHVTQAIKAYNERYKNIVIPEGCKLKRTPAKYLLDHDMFNAGDLISEFNKILEKKSSLSASVRELVKTLVMQGIYTLHLADQRKAKEESLKSSEDGNEEESRG